jgi:hypothetical protein
LKKILALFCILPLISCAASRPALHSNAHLKEVGYEQAQKDIDECCQVAEHYVNRNFGTMVAGNIAVMYKQLVNRCLIEDGYEPEGW